MAKKNRPKRRSGFADTKKYPHRDHPANYRHLSQDNIEYITFTHHSKVKIKDIEFDTIPLNSNIDPVERKNNPNNKSYVYPKKFVGKRSALGKERNNLSLIDSDKKIVDKLFDVLPTENVRYSKKNKKK